MKGCASSRALAFVGRVYPRSSLDSSNMDERETAASVVQFSRGFDLQKGHVRVIGLTGSTSNARLDFGIPHILLSKQPLTSANAGDDGQVENALGLFGALQT